MRAVRNNDKDLVEFLIQKGSKDPWANALKDAVDNDDEDMVELLLIKHKVSKDPYGTALSTAAQKENIKMVKFLIANGIKDTKGKALIYTRNTEIINLLKQKRKEDPQGFRLPYREDDF